MASMKLHWVIPFLLFKFLYGETLVDPSCTDPADPLQQQICRLQSLISLYTQKLSLLQSLKPPNSTCCPAPPSSPNLLPKLTNPNYTSSLHFLPPYIATSNGGLYNMNGKFIRQIQGKVIDVERGEVTVLRDRTVVVVMADRERVEVWGEVQEDWGEGGWVGRGRKGRTFFQYQSNRVVFTEGKTSMQVILNSDIIIAKEILQSLVFVCRKSVGWVGLKNYAVTYLREIKENGQIVAAAIRAPHTVYLLDNKNTLLVLDIKMNMITSQTNLTQLIPGHTFTQLSLSGPVLFLYTLTSPTLHALNLSTTPITLSTSFSPCVSSPQSNYTFSFGQSPNSVYISCCSIGQSKSEVRVYEYVLPEMQVGELIGGWWQVVVVGMAVMVGVWCARGREKVKVEGVGKGKANMQMKEMLRKSRDDDQLSGDFLKQLQQMAIKYKPPTQHDLLSDCQPPCPSTLQQKPQ